MSHDITCTNSMLLANANKVFMDDKCLSTGDRFHVTIIIFLN